MIACPFLAFSKAKDLKHFLLFQVLSPRHWSTLCEAKRDRYQHNSFLSPKLETCRVGFCLEMRRDEEECTWDRPRRGGLIWRVGSNDPVRCPGFLHDVRHAFRRVKADLISRKVRSVCRAQDKYLKVRKRVKKKRGKWTVHVPTRWRIKHSFTVLWFKTIHGGLSLDT